MIVRNDLTTEFRDFVERFNLPVLATINGKDALPNDHPLLIGTVSRWLVQSVKHAFNSADLIVTVGHDLSEWSMDGLIDDESKTVNIDFLPTNDEKYSPSLDLIGDVGKILSWLIKKQGKAVFKSKNTFLDVREMLGSELKKFTDYVSSGIKPVLLLNEIRKVLSGEDIFVSDVGMHKHWAAYLYPSLKPKTTFFSNGFSSVGFALPAAIAAKLARPKQNVLAFCGDGGFMMNVQDFATSMRYDLPIVSVIVNDSSYGLIKLHQHERFGLTHGVDLTNPDFVKLAESFGGEGFRVENQRELAEALKRAVKADTSVVIDVPVTYRL